MPGDSPLVSSQPLAETVRKIIAEVLVMSPDEVQPGKALIRDLGAESIDFMDLVFRLEDELAIRIPFQRWQGFMEESLRGEDLAVAITPEVVQRFAERELSRA